MPEDIQPQAQGTEQTPTGLEAPPVQAADATQRADIQRKYEERYGQQPAEPAAQPAVASAAPVQPAGTPAPASDLGAVVQSLLAEVGNLRQKLEASAQPVAAAQIEEDWLKMLAEGKKGEGEKLLAQRVAALQGDSIQNQAVERTMALIEMRDFVNEIKAKPENSIILPMEQYITMAAQARIAAAQQSGKIRNPADYVTVYKEAVNAEIENARKLAFSYRGEGRQEGVTRTTQVMASPTLQPQSVSTDRGQSAPQEAQPETLETYFANRQASQARQRGLSGR